MDHFHTDDSSNSYIHITFSETSYLVTLGDLPNYLITVWNWAKNEKIASTRSSILAQQQQLKYNDK